MILHVICLQSGIICNFHVLHVVTSLHNSRFLSGELSRTSHALRKNIYFLLHIILECWTFFEALLRGVCVCGGGGGSGYPISHYFFT